MDLLLRMGSMAELGPQQLKSARVREAICRAAISCLIEVGYAETSVQRIVDKAEVSKGALQHHFRTKEDLVAAVVETLLGRTLARTFPLRAQDGLDGNEVVAAELRAVWTDFIDTGAYRALLEILVVTRTDAQLRARIEPILHQYNQDLDRHQRQSYEAVSGDTADVEMLLVMNRALMRGLVIQDRYVADPGYNARIIERWISLAAPLLRPRRKLCEVDRSASDKALPR
jgi:AcrR family transcriptional regulator